MEIFLAEHSRRAEQLNKQARAGGALVELNDPNIRPRIAILVQADLPFPARREHEVPSIERNIAERFGPVILGIPYGAIVSKSPDSRSIKIRFEAENLAVVGLRYCGPAIGSIGRTAHWNIVIEVPSAPCEMFFHSPEVGQRQRVDELSVVRNVAERPTVDIHLVGDAGSVDFSVVTEGVIAAATEAALVVTRLDIERIQIPDIIAFVALLDFYILPAA